MSCPSNSIRYNSTLCACPPGQLLNRTTNNCALFTSSSDIVTDNGVDYYAVSFPETIFSFDSIKKFTQSQAVFLEATLVLLLSWLLFCFFLRFMKLSDGTNIWFRIRWWISRLDICFSTRHWLDDQKVVRKRKTELGGAFSIASWILFIGLFAALLYQIIAKRTIEVHNVRATNAPDLASFMNDMEFNITTISSMSCASVRGLGSLVIGNPGFFDQKVLSLSNYVNYSCHNTTQGPTISLKCNSCQLIQDSIYVSWQFADLPNTPASAVGFQFNITTRNHSNKKHMSFVSGTLKNGSTFDDRPVTFRGRDANILKFNLFPRIYHNLHDLKLIQPLFHEFVPGSFFTETSRLQSSLENFNDGILNTTLYINLLSSYIVEIDNQSVMGPVSFLADLGGLYCVSIGIFFYLLVQFEYRIKRFRNEDGIMRKIRGRKKAQERWDKLRKYVMYTWGCSTLDASYHNTKKESGSSCFMIQSNYRNGSSRKQKQQSRHDSLNFNKKVTTPSKKTAAPECTNSQGVKSLTASNMSNHESKVTEPTGKPPLEHEELVSTKSLKQHSGGLCKGDTDTSEYQAVSFADDSIIPPPPKLEFKDEAETDMSDVLKNIKSLYEYNVMLREKFIATQSLLRALQAKSSPGTESQTEHIND